mmetsp:Transcript_11022/g.23016  ORF Transcript_11022/g.23016 Transcript_11022/m.23016 type:complete len:222 (-) Transcript_11022:96-761(-)
MYSNKTAEAENTLSSSSSPVTVSFSVNSLETVPCFTPMATDFGVSSFAPVSAPPPPSSVLVPAPSLLPKLKPLLPPLNAPKPPPAPDPPPKLNPPLKGFAVPAAPVPAVVAAADALGSAFLSSLLAFPPSAFFGPSSTLSPAALGFTAPKPPAPLPKLTPANGLTFFASPPPTEPNPPPPPVLNDIPAKGLVLLLASSSSFLAARVPLSSSSSSFSFFFFL